jgi:hypothetical protein
MTDAIPMTVLKVSHHTPKHMAERYPYAGYGSNLWMSQITERCPHVELVIAGRILDHRLDFARVATITQDKTSTVPVGIYRLTADDIEKLDRKEGLGKAYDRYLITPITDDNRALRCFTYIKRDPTLEPPTDKYFMKLVAGYRDWHFDDRRLRHARSRAAAAWLAGAPERDRKRNADIIADVERIRQKYVGKSAGEAWRQGEMWEPVDDVEPVRPKRYVTMRHDGVEFGTRDGVFYFRQLGTRVWYRDVSGHEHISSGMVCGELAENLPGAKAYKPIDNKRGKK